MDEREWRIEDLRHDFPNASTHCRRCGKAMGNWTRIKKGIGRTCERKEKEGWKEANYSLPFGEDHA
mgnify:CR=1 FL=1